MEAFGAGWQAAGRLRVTIPVRCMRCTTLTVEGRLIALTSAYATRSGKQAGGQYARPAPSDTVRADARLDDHLVRHGLLTARQDDSRELIGSASSCHRAASTEPARYLGCQGHRYTCGSRTGALARWHAPDGYPDHAQWGFELVKATGNP